MANIDANNVSNQLYSSYKLSNQDAWTKLGLPGQFEGNYESSAKLAEAINSKGGLSYFGTPTNTSELGVMTTDMATGMVNQDQKTLDMFKGLPDLNKVREGDVFQIGNQSYTKTPDGSFQLVGGAGNTGGSGGTAGTVATGGTTQSTGDKTVSEPGKIKYLNLDGQIQELTGDAITPDAVQKLLDQGYYSIESTGSVPSWATTGDVASGRATAQANADLNNAKLDLDAMKAKLSSFMVSDSQLKAQTDAITKLWDTRIADMQRVNARREASIKTLGIRLGNRYTGGEGGVFGGIITEEERQGVSRIAELEAKKQEAISGAEESAREKNWEVFGVQVKNAEDIYKDKLDAVKELNKATVENNKKLAEREAEVQRDADVADLIAQGVTSSAAIMQKLGKKYTAEEVSSSLKNLLPSGLDDIVKTAAANGASQEVIKSILSSASVADAYAAAGSYLQGGSGIVGEYQFYKRQAEAAGQIPVDFNTYQDMDANRKKSIAQAGVMTGSDLNTKEQAAFNHIVDRRNASPAIRALARANMLKNIIAEAKKDPGNATNQLALIYSYIKGLDTDSAVREGEIDLVKSVQSYLSQFGTQLSKISEGKIVDAKTATQIAAGAESVVKAIEDTARMKEASYKAQARGNGTKVFEAYIDFQKNELEFQGAGIETEIIQNEADAEKKVQEIYPQFQEQIEKLLIEFPDISNLDILQILGQ